MSVRVPRIEAPTAGTSRRPPNLVPLDFKRVRRNRVVDNWVIAIMILCASLFAIAMARTFWPVVRPLVEAPASAGSFSEGP